MCDVRARLGWNDRFVIGFVGSMKRWHGVDTLLQALALVGGSESPFRLLLVGSGPELTALSEQRDRLGLTNAVHMTGAVAHDAVPGLLRAMNVAAATYAIDAEEYFSPVKLFEYMATGLPVVAARVGQVPDIIDEGRTGWLYAPGDARYLAELFAQLAADPDRCRSVGAAARDRIARHHTWRRNARRVIRIAENAIKKRTTSVSPLSFGRRASAGTPSDASMRRR